MIKLLKNNKSIPLKTKIINTLMINGKKNTGEKIVLQFAKRLQKAINKNIKSVTQLAIVNSTPTFKLNEQIIKKGKQKVIRSTPSFIPSTPLRIMKSLRFIKDSILQNKSTSKFYKALFNEILASSDLKSQSVTKKNELQKQILLNKRYLSKFRW